MLFFYLIKIQCNCNLLFNRLCFFLLVTHFMRRNASMSNIWKIFHCNLIVERHFCLFFFTLCLFFVCISIFIRKSLFINCNNRIISNNHIRLRFFFFVIKIRFTIDFRLLFLASFVCCLSDFFFFALTLFHHKHKCVIRHIHFAELFCNSFFQIFSCLLPCNTCLSLCFFRNLVRFFFL